MSENSSKISVALKNWSDKGYSVVSLHLVEEIGGSLSRGILELDLPETDKALENITKETHGILIIRDEKEGGKEYQIPIFIEKRNYWKNLLTLKFVCIGDEDFFTRLNSIRFESIDEALNKLYNDSKNDPNKIHIDVSSDINNNIPIFQNRETNYELLKKLALGYKKNCIYGFGWEGFVLKDLTADPEVEVVGGTTSFSTDTFNLNYNKLLNNQPYNPWVEKSDLDDSFSGEQFDDFQARYCKVSVDYDNYIIFGKDYIDLHKNLESNSSILESSLRTDLEISRFDLPKDYSLGSIIKYGLVDQKQEYPFNKFVVAGNDFYFSQNGASYYSPHGARHEFITKLHGLDDGDWSKTKEQ